MGIDFDEIERRHAADRRQREIDQRTPAPPAPRPPLGQGPVSTALGYLLLVGLAALVVWAIVGVVTGGGDDDSGPDGSAKLACGHFRNVMDDVADGVVTDSELRTRAQEVDSNASASTWPGLAEASRAFLASTTSGAGVLESASDLADACSTVPSL